MLAALNFLRMLLLCLSTVLTSMKSNAAISLLHFPKQHSSRIESCLLVRFCAIVYKELRNRIKFVYRIYCLFLICAMIKMLTVLCLLLM